MSTVIDRRSVAGGKRSPIRIGRECDRTPRPEWQRELDRIAPPAASVSSLRITWLPGDFWDPVERWVIWQVYPEGVVPQLAQEAVRGPHPRSTGHACLPRINGQKGCDCGSFPPWYTWRHRWVGGPPESAGISKWTYELFQETGRFHRLYWIVQGTLGGHRYKYTAQESRLSVLHGGPEQPPAPGDLCYAEPDHRTFARIGAADQLRRWRGLRDFTARDGRDLDQMERDQSEAYQEHLWQWMDDQLTEPTDKLRFEVRRRSELPRMRAGETPRVIDPDLELEKYKQQDDLRPLTTVA